MYENYEKVSIGRRYLTGLVDLLFVFVLSLLFYLFVGFPLGKQSCNFDENVLYQKQLGLDIYEHMYETHLYVKDQNGEPLNAKGIYNLYVESLLSNQEKDENGKYTNLFAYYYITYDHSMSVEQFNHEILEINQEDSLFTYRNDDSNLVGELKSDVYSFMNQYVSGIINTETDDMNNRLSYHFQKKWMLAVEHEKKSDFMVDIVNKFNQSLYKQGYGIGIPALIIYGVFMITFTLIIPLICKGNTLGNKIIRTQTLSIKNKRPNAIAIIFKSLIQIIMFTFIPFLCVAMITGIENACKVPLFSIHNMVIPLATISFTLILLGVINLFILSINKRHQSYAELITGTYCADFKNIEKENEKKSS